MAQHNIENILAIYQLATPAEIAHGRRWYGEAKEACEIIASRYGLPVLTVVGVTASLSPRNRWSRNLQDCEALCAAFVTGGRDQAEQTKVCTFSANREKAIKCLELTGSDFTAQDVLELLRGPKLREFASCILGLEDVCIDGHAYCIHAGGRTTLAEVPSIGAKLRKIIKSDYTEAAASLIDTTPAELQAITWVTWRRIHGITK